MIVETDPRAFAKEVIGQAAELKDAFTLDHEKKLERLENRIVAEIELARSARDIAYNRIRDLENFLRTVLASIDAIGVTVEQASDPLVPVLVTPSLVSELASGFEDRRKIYDPTGKAGIVVAALSAVDHPLEGSWCSVCKTQRVDAENGFDTCEACLASQ